MNKVEYTVKAIKQLRKIDNTQATRIRASIDELSGFPDCLGDIKKLTGRPEFRLRVGRYRAIFTHNETIRLVRIEEVKKRDERTY